MTVASVTIQITPDAQPSTPCWMGEVAAFAQVLTQTGMLSAIAEQVRFARARFGQYEVIDMVAVLIGYILSGAPTLLAFYERLAPFASPFVALFGRNRLPHRSTLSRFLAALDQAPVETLRTLFQKDLLARKPFFSPGGFYMLRVSVIVALVLRGHSARSVAPRSNHDGSARSCVRFPLLASIPRRLPIRPVHHAPLLRFSGVIGHGATFGAPG